MENMVILDVKKDIIGLAGYEYGEQIFLNQVKDKIDINKEFYIQFPSNIKFVASSFVQGFFSHIIQEIGLSLTEERTKILSENGNIREKLMSKLI